MAPPADTPTLAEDIAMVRTMQRRYPHDKTHQVCSFCAALRLADAIEAALPTIDAAQEATAPPFGT